MAKHAAKRAEGALREIALAYPEAREDFPWGHSAFKVGRKVFLFMGTGADGDLSLSVKLTASHASALDRAFTSPTHYGLGKHGWVSSQFAPNEDPPLELLRAWIDESYRVIAPKKLVALLAGGRPEKPVARRPTTRPTTRTAGASRKKSVRRKR